MHTIPHITIQQFLSFKHEQYKTLFQNMDLNPNKKYWVLKLKILSTLSENTVMS